jgi:hypothetical protein
MTCDAYECPNQHVERGHHAFPFMLTHADGWRMHYVRDKRMFLCPSHAKAWEAHKDVMAP